MAKKRKQIRFEGGNEDWSASSSNSSRSSVASYHRDSYPKKGKTRIPARLVSKRALVDLGYPFVEEGTSVILLVALDERLIEEVLKLSQEYRRSDEGTHKGEDVGGLDDQARDRGFDWVNVEAPVEEPSQPEPGYDEASESDGLDSTFDDTDPDDLDGPVAYSGIVNLNTTKVLGEKGVDSTAGRFPAWSRENSDLINGTTHLYSVHAAEFYMDRAGNQKITLVCPKDPGNGMSEPSLVRMRWLHLQAESLNVATLEVTTKGLVADCPYISQSLKLVALTVLKDVTARCVKPSEVGSYIEPGSTVQYVGKYNRSLGTYPGDDISDTEPVVFLSAPYLVLAERPSRKRHHGNHYTRSLLEVLYGYDDGASEERTIGAKTLPGDAKESATLQVPQLWSLIVGADLIITCSELSSEEIRKDLIVIDRKESPLGVYTIRLIDEKDTCRYHIVIKPDCKYVDFLRHAVSLVRRSRSNAMAYVLVDDSGVLITADIWLHLLAEGLIEDYVFCLRPKHSAHRAPDDDFRALSAKLTAGSRSSLGRYSRRSSFRSEFKGSSNNMQMVVHPGMWEYGAGSQLPDLEDDMKSDGSDLELETSTLSFGSHLNDNGVEGSSIDGIVDLTSSASETSFKPRRSHTPRPVQSFGDLHVPELYDMNHHMGLRNEQKAVNESPYSRAESAISCDRPDMRFILRRGETTRSADSEATNPTTPPSWSRQRSPGQSWNYSRASTFSYAHDSPLDSGEFNSPFRSPEPFGMGTSRAGSFRDPDPSLGPVPNAYSTSHPTSDFLPLNIPYVDLVPFLTWRLTWDDDKRSRAEIDRTLFQLLSNLSAAMESDRISRWYRMTFECTQIELVERFGCLLESLFSFRGHSEGPQNLDHSKTASPIRHSDAEKSQTVDHSSNQQKPNLEDKASAREAAESLPTRASTLYESIDVDDRENPAIWPGSEGESYRDTDCDSASKSERKNPGDIFRHSNWNNLDLFLLRRILEVSHDALGAFLPREGGFVAHSMCKRFWGSVDTILRQIWWSLNLGDETEKQSWVVVRSVLRSPPQEMACRAPEENAPVDCSECQESKEYDTADDALDHWHRNHMQKPCSQPAQRGTPFDDPCLIWIYRVNRRETTVRQPNRIRTATISTAELFYEEVQNIVQQTEELHKLVTSVCASDDPFNSNCRPHLPSSLVNAFEGILSMYILKSKELSWMNRFAARSHSTYSRNAERRLNRLREAGKLTSRQVRKHLMRAKEDIIMLGTTKGDMERIIIAPVGPEFLAASLITSLQNNIPIPGTERRLDLINHYRSHTSRLWFNTSRRPNRSAFVEIHALEEELEALRTVFASQQSLLRSYQKHFSPVSFKSRTTDRLYYKERKAFFRLENKCIRRQQRRLAERDQALSILQRKVRVLRDETKQRIEILDEGHGKAIRVFTIVTLFFLPLSFVTSFFGMNTTDIRDINHDQKIFWTSALPVTLGVLGLAFLYGYKWDAILAWASRTFKSSDKDTPSYTPQYMEKLTWMTATEQRSSELPIYHERASLVGWKNRVSFLSRRKSKRKDFVSRKKTDDSLFRP